MLKKTIIILVLLYATAFAGRYVVSNASEINTAMQTAVPGDTLVMSNGVWTDQRIVFSGYGEPGKHIVLTAETPGYVVLNGISTLRIAGEYLTVNGLYFLDGYSTSGAVIEFRNGSGKEADNCRLTNTAIVNYNPAGNSTDYKWISLYGTYNRVDHCYLRGKKHSGTTLVVWLDGNPNYHLIDSNYFAFRPELGVNGGETIRIGTSTNSMSDSYTTVEYNLFEQCNGETEIISNKSGHNIYRYNTFYESEGGLTLRHGNFAEVYGNFFIGNGKRLTGGVRIIGEDHIVYNNYFENLDGTGYRGALVMMNGVPDSPLNRYFRVMRAQVINNTFVNCEETFNIGAGADSELSLPPLDCVIANNTVISNDRIINYIDDPENISYEGNIMFSGLLGIDRPVGISLIDPMLSQAEDGLWRPADNSPVIDASAGSYDFVTVDIDGQERSGVNDVGADEVSADPITNRPMNSDNTGPAWYPPPAIPVKVFEVNAGQDSLLHALNNYEEGDIIRLMTDGGIYNNSENLIINVPVVIEVDSGLVIRPVIVQNNPSTSTRTVFEIRDGGSLNLTGVEIDGLADTDTPAKYLIRTDDDPFETHYNLKIDDCYLHNVNADGFGNLFRAYAGTFADSILINNSLFSDCSAEGVRLIDEESNSGNYNVNVLRIANSTFWNIGREAIRVYGGDNVIFTPGPVLSINHCTFNNVGAEEKYIILAEDCDNTIVRNSIFSNSPNSVSLYGQLSSISYSDIYNAGEVNLSNGAKSGSGMVDYDPLFVDADIYDFTLLSNSPLLTIGDDGKALGDLRWAVNEPDYYVLTLAKFGEGEIVVSPESTGLNYQPGTIVGITAIPAEGFRFDSWSGDASGSDSTIQITMDDNKSVVAVFGSTVNVADESGLPDKFTMYQNYPNPFNPSTTIKYAVPEYSAVCIVLYDIQGRMIKILLNKNLSAGYYEYNFDMGSYSSGIYIIRMKSEDVLLSQKILLVK